MTLVAITLFGIALSDLLRTATRLRKRRRGTAVSVGAGLVSMAGFAALSSPPRWGDVSLLGWGGVVLVVWTLSCIPAMHHKRPASEPIVVLVGGLALMAAFGGYASDTPGLLQQWMTWSRLPQFQGVTEDKLLITVAVFLAQLSTGNILVRLVLVGTGAIRPAGQPQPGDQLKGGRLLGPMERLFILGLGLSGQTTAAGLVVAAKGLIRWPELQSRAARSISNKNEPGIDAITEYFLIGSFVSWLVALISLAIAK